MRIENAYEIVLYISVVLLSWISFIDEIKKNWDISIVFLIKYPNTIILYILSINQNKVLDIQDQLWRTLSFENIEDGKLKIN